MERHSGWNNNRQPNKTKHGHVRHPRVFCELKAPGSSSTNWTLNSYDKVNPAILFGFDVKKKILNCFILENVISSQLLARFDFNNRSVALFTRTTWSCSQQDSDM